jgi:hypothetical protein
VLASSSHATSEQPNGEVGVPARAAVAEGV